MSLDSAPPANLTTGTLLGGRIQYTQLAEGYRTGIEPILLAAMVPARPGDRVLEAGTGAGAGLLALAARVARLRGLGIEQDSALAQRARANLAANQHTQIEILTADITGWTPSDMFDHAFANPPWHSAHGTASPEPGRARAKIAGPDLPASWITPLARALRPRGTLSLILPAASLTQAMVALAAAECAQTTLLPLWPHQGEPAKLMLLRAIRRGRGPSSIHPGLVLHEAGGSFTPAAEAILRHGAELAHPSA